MPIERFVRAAAWALACGIVAGRGAAQSPDTTPPPAPPADTAPAPAPRGAVPTSAPTAADGPLWLEVVLAERRLYVRRGDAVVGTFDVAVGKEEHPTPTGEFRIQRVIWNPAWVPPPAPWARGKRPKPPGHPDNPMGRVKLFFLEPDYYLHGTNDESSLGRAASHGCVRLRNEDVVAVARLVMEHGGAPRPPSWFQRVLNFFRRTHEVRLREPVRLVIR